ncbi:hypothetical protein HZH66_009257 [Vespula vulgaris]|uniref:Uncharacterized protein n=1 Tax=Vespula vulgaris TaxID=7454 RepID=A0A834JP99_VESVU|nr:hypothetical protein HZH66_009257 [Vespula vulgaris]
MICSINVDIEEIDKQFTSITEFEGADLNENGYAFDICRLQTDTARTKTKDRSLRQCKKALEGVICSIHIEIEERDKQFKSMTEFEEENLNENGYAFDTSRLKTDNARTRTNDRSLIHYIEEIDKQFTSMIEFEGKNLNENGNTFHTSRLRTSNAKTKTKDRSFTQLIRKQDAVFELDKKVGITLEQKGRTTKGSENENPIQQRNDGLFIGVETLIELHDQEEYNSGIWELTDIKKKFRIASEWIRGLLDRIATYEGLTCSHGGRTDTTIKETPVDGIDMFRVGRLPVVPFSTNAKGH